MATSRFQNKVKPLLLTHTDSFIFRLPSIHGPNMAFALIIVKGQSEVVTCKQKRHFKPEGVTRNCNSLEQCRTLVTTYYVVTLCSVIYKQLLKNNNVTLKRQGTANRMRVTASNRGKLCPLTLFILQLLLRYQKE